MNEDKSQMQIPLCFNRAFVIRWTLQPWREWCPSPRSVSCFYHKTMTSKSATPRSWHYSDPFHTITARETNKSPKSVFPNLVVFKQAAQPFNTGNNNLVMQPSSSVATLNTTSSVFLFSDVWLANGSLLWVSSSQRMCQTISKAIQSSSRVDKKESMKSNIYLQSACHTRIRVI